MNLADGNIFEAMRLVLPEHRELMNALEQVGNVQRKPELSEDALLEYGYLWTAAYQQQFGLKLTLSAATEGSTVSGVPASPHSPLRLQTGQGCIMILREDILHMERI